MANFNTHLAVGAVASGLAATVAMASGVVPQHYLLTLTLAGVIGSILPDVDLEKAVPSQMVFGGLGVVFAFVTLFNFDRQYSIVELWIAWLAVYIGVRHGVFYVFHRRTKHRGIFHSLLAGLFFAAMTAMIFANVFNEDALHAWIAGMFIFFGYVVHLSLDEFSSVDFEGKKIKKSFGSALKLFDYGSMKSSAMMAGAVVFMLALAPPPNDFIDLVRSRAVWADLHQRLWPAGQWFEMRMSEADTASLPQIGRGAAAPDALPQTVTDAAQVGGASISR